MGLITNQHVQLTGFMTPEFLKIITGKDCGRNHSIPWSYKSHNWHQKPPSKAIYWEVKLPRLKGIGQNPIHGRKPKVKPRSNDRWQRPVNGKEITWRNSFLTFHSHKNNRTLKLNNDILKGNTSANDVSCIVQPPGHTPKPEFHTVQVCVGRGDGGWKCRESREMRKRGKKANT